jgi:hypothetical protein
MERPKKNDLFYQLMQDGKLQLEDPGFEEDVVRKLQETLHRRSASRTMRKSVLFLSLSIILGLGLCALHAAYYSSEGPADHTVSLLLQAILVLTFLFLLEKIIQLLKVPVERSRS